MILIHSRGGQRRIQQIVAVIYVMNLVYYSRKGSKSAASTHHLDASLRSSNGSSVWHDGRRDDSVQIRISLLAHLHGRGLDLSFRWRWCADDSSSRSASYLACWLTKQSLILFLELKDGHIHLPHQTRRLWRGTNRPIQWKVPGTWSRDTGSCNRKKWGKDWLHRSWMARPLRRYIAAGRSLYPKTLSRDQASSRRSVGKWLTFETKLRRKNRLDRLG